MDFQLYSEAITDVIVSPDSGVEGQGETVKINYKNGVQLVFFAFRGGKNNKFYHLRLSNVLMNGGIVEEHNINGTKIANELYKNKTLNTKTTLFGRGEKFCPMQTKVQKHYETTYVHKGKLQNEFRWREVFKLQEEKMHEESVKYALDYLFAPNSLSKEEMEMGEMKNGRNGNSAAIDYIKQYAWYLLFEFGTTIEKASEDQVISFIDSVKEKVSTGEVTLSYAQRVRDVIDLYDYYNHSADFIKNLYDRAKDFLVPRHELTPDRVQLEEIVYLRKALKEKMNSARERYERAIPSRRLMSLNKYTQSVRDYAIFLLVRKYGLTPKEIVSLKKVTTNQSGLAVGFPDEEWFGYDMENGLLYLEQIDKEQAIKLDDVTKKYIDLQFKLLNNPLGSIFVNAIKLGEEAEFLPIKETVVRRACEVKYEKIKKNEKKEVVSRETVDVKLTPSEIRNFRIKEYMEQLDIDEFEAKRMLRTSVYTVKHYKVEIKHDEVEKARKMEETKKQQEKETQLTEEMFHKTLKQKRFSVKNESIHLVGTGFIGFSDSNYFKNVLFHYPEHVIFFLKKHAQSGELTNVSNESVCEHCKKESVQKELVIPFYKDVENKVFHEEFVTIFEGEEFEDKEENARQYVKKVAPVGQFLLMINTCCKKQKWSIRTQ